MWTPEDRALVGDYGSGQALSDDQYRLFMKRHFLAHRTFPFVEHLEFAIKHTIIELNRERQRKVCHDQRIAA